MCDFSGYHGYSLPVVTTVTWSTSEIRAKFRLNKNYFIMNEKLNKLLSHVQQQPVAGLVLVLVWIPI